MKSACHSECCVIESSVSQSPNYSLQKHLQKLLMRKSLYCIFKMIAIRLKARWERDYTNSLLFIMCFWVGKLSKTLTWWPILINQVCWPNRKSSPLKTKCLLPVGTNKVKRNSPLGSPLWYWKFAAKKKKKKIEIWFIFMLSLWLSGLDN